MILFERPLVCLCWARSQISRRVASTTAIDTGMSMHPKKQRNISFLVCLANDWFEATFIGGDAAPASGRFEPKTAPANLVFSVSGYFGPVSACGFVSQHSVDPVLPCALLHWSPFVR